MSITDFSFACTSLKFFLVAKPMSTFFVGRKFSFSLTPTFASLATDVALSITLFLMNLYRMVCKMFWRYSAMNGSIGLSLWNPSRNRHSIFETVTKNCNFALMKGSFTCPWNWQSCDSLESYIWVQQISVICMSSYQSISLLLSQQQVHPLST